MIREKRREKMLAIRLARFGAKKKPTYRVVVIEQERARNSRSVEVVGVYNPIPIRRRCNLNTTASAIG